MRHNLFEFGTEMLAFFRQLIPLMMMSWSNRECGLPPHLAQADPPPVRTLRRIAAFLEEEMRLGRLRRQDPEILARVLVGSVQNYVFHEVILEANGQQPLPAETYLRGLVDLIWTGAAPTAEEKPA